MDRKARIAELEARAGALEARLKAATLTQTIIPTESLGQVLAGGYMRALADKIREGLKPHGLTPTLVVREIEGGAQAEFTIEDDEGSDVVVLVLDLRQKRLWAVGTYDSQGGAEKKLLDLGIVRVLSLPLQRIAAMFVAEAIK